MNAPETPRTIAIAEKGLEEIAAAYEAGRRGTYPLGPLPAWEDLPIEMRLAMVRVYYAGRLAGVLESLR